MYDPRTRPFALQEGFYGCMGGPIVPSSCDASAQPPPAVAQLPIAQRHEHANGHRQLSFPACSLVADTNFKAHTIGDPVNVSTPTECCARCHATPRCVAFSFNPRTARGLCDLKSAVNSNPNPSPGTVSGTIGPAPPTPPTPSPPAPPTNSSGMGWSYRGLRVLDAVSGRDLTYAEWCSFNGTGVMTTLYNNTADPFQLHNLAKDVPRPPAPARTH